MRYLNLPRLHSWVTTATRLTLERSRLRLLLGALALCSAIPLTLAQQPSGMSDEERIVRTTYARLSYAVQVGQVHQAISDSEAETAKDRIINPAAKDRMIDPAALAQHLKNAELTFALSDFKVGNVTDADIGQTLYSALVTKPSGDVLAVTPGTTNFTTDSPPDGSHIPLHTQSTIAGAQWTRSQTITEDWEQPWAKLFPMIENSRWFTRYASFKVRVSFQGRSREYRAMFLFGRDPKTGLEHIVPGDTVVQLNGGALSFFIKNSAYPEALIEGGIGRNIPAVHDWLRAQAAPGKPHEDNCDPVTLKCGVSQQDLQKLEMLPQKLQMKAVPPLALQAMTSV